jgi:hypothetical protein
MGVDNWPALLFLLDFCYAGGMTWGVGLVMHQYGAWRNIKGQHTILLRKHICAIKNQKLTMGVVNWPALFVW